MGILLPQRLIKAHFGQQLRVTLGGNTTFTRHNHHRIAGDHMDEGKGEKGDTDKCRDDESQTSENKLQHNPDSL
ncbi:Uncharacterised protein [Klebsiella aerogenes]|nr:Uncharacterised protein [Klebsiella aerogenes]